MTRTARRRGVMLMPGAGFDVVPSDCLALHMARRVRGARRLMLGISGLEVISRGSFRTLADGAGQSIRDPPGREDRRHCPGLAPA